jgi:hypothetical protein
LFIAYHFTVAADPAAPMGDTDSCHIYSDAYLDVSLLAFYLFLFW